MNELPPGPPASGSVHVFAHPDRMAVRASLHGLAVTPPPSATTVELGSGEGWNLLSLAQAYPEARFIGIEPAAGAVARAADRAHRSGLVNVTFRAADPAGAELPAADYLIALDSVSYLSPAARTAFLASLGRALRPGGVALVSFDTLPGSADFAPLRDLMRYHVKNLTEPERALRGARDIALWHVNRIERLVGEERVGVMRRYLDELARTTDEELWRLLRAPEYHPLQLTDFAAELDRHGLRWLANARMEEPRAQQLPGPLRDIAQCGDVLRRQQYLDFFLMTRARASLVCRADEPIVREVAPTAFRPFQVAGRFTRAELGGVGTVSIATPVGPLTFSEAASELLRRTGDAAPAARPCQWLLDGAEGEAADALLVALAELWQADAVELATAPPAVAFEPPPFPSTGPLQRLQAAEQAGRDSGRAISLWHREGMVGADELAALALMDGTRPRAAFDDDVLEALLAKGFCRPG